MIFLNKIPILTMRKRSSEKIVIDSEEVGIENGAKIDKKIRQKDKTVFVLIFGVLSGFLMGYFSTYLSENMICTIEDMYEYKVKINEHPSKIDELTHLNSDLTRKEYEYKIDTSVADRYKEKMEILCWVITSKRYHTSRAYHLKNTWGKRCDILIFFSDAEDDELPAIRLEEYEDDNVFGKWKRLMKALDYLYSNYYFKADWFLKVDDTNYVIMENLRYLLAHYSKDDDYYIGVRYSHPDIPQGYLADKAGYVLSKEGLQKIAITVVPHWEKILPDWKEIFNNDQKLGYILQKAEMKIVDSRDSYGKERFHPFDPKTHACELPTNDTDLMDFYLYRYYKKESGEQTTSCCSETSITFGNISPCQMYTMEYTVYSLRPFGFLKY